MKKMSNFWRKVFVFLICTCMIIAVRVNETSAETLWCDEEHSYRFAQRIIEEKGGDKEDYEYFLEGNYGVFSQMIAASLFEHGIWTDKVEEIKKAGFWEDDYYPPFDEIKDNGAAHFKWDDDNGVMKTANSVIDARHWWQTAYNLMPSGYTPSTCNISKKYVPLKEYGPDAYMQQSALRELKEQLECYAQPSASSQNITFDKTHSVWKNAKERGNDYIIYYSGKMITKDVEDYYEHPSKYKGLKRISDEDFKLTPRLKLSSTAYTYNGKNHKPKVLAITYDGYVYGEFADNYEGDRTEIRGLKIKYDNCKNIGTATVKVTILYGGNLYGETYTATYKINPQKTDCISVKSTKANKVNLSWNKVTNITGYQIQYAYNKDFKNAKIETVSSASAVSKTIGNLKSGKTVYVRIRTYKTVSGKNYYSAWDKNTGTATKIK